MLCSECNEKKAIIFINEKNSDGTLSSKGYCADCAKKLGINPINIFGDIQNNPNIAQVAKQFENIFQDISENLNLDDISNIEGAFNLENEDGDISATAIPLGSIFSGAFQNEQNQDNSKKVKTDKKKPKKPKKKKFLDAYGTNLTQKAKNGELDSVIGREEELKRVIQILNRRTKNNPCLIGEPGVGKTAIAQGLAIAIANNEVPAKLLGYEVYLLDMASMVAGTQFRGQFEQRMKGVIGECETYGNIILVIDEIHTIIGAGDSEKSTNAANILKPALSNGTIQLVGATTINEYRKYIEKDAALERRFQPVLVEEPNIDDSIKILEGIKKYYEDYHKVKISNDIIRQTVIMSQKYIHDRNLPDKAIDILDEACSRINLNNTELAKLELLKSELNDILEQKNEFVAADSSEDYEKAAILKSKELSLTDQINVLSAKIKPIEITIQDIANVIESWTKIPVKKITETETLKLLNLEENLHKRVIGQDKAINAVSRAIRRNRAGLQSTKRPPSFIFVGPTGVGKTELSKALAFEMFGSDSNIIRFDMSEYMESHSTAKLIGAPPGYVGYDDARQLTEKVKRKPYSIILLDEIEKAHKDVFNILLQVLDDGKLTDAQGSTVNFSNTIIIMTSNARSELNNNSIGFGNSRIDKNKVEDNLKQIFRPEFLNRVDEIIQFDMLDEKQLLQIVDLMLKDTIKALDDKNIKFEIASDAKDLLLQKGTNIKFGARPLRRAIQRYIEDEISEMILKNEVYSGKTVCVTKSKDDFKFKVV